MYQIVGTSKIHPFVALDALGAPVTTLTTPTVTYRINGGTKTTLDTPTVSAYDSDMRDFLLTVPDTLAVNPYETVTIAITAAEGTADIKIDIVPPPSLIATAVWSGTEGAAVHTATTSTLTLAAIKAQAAAAISDFETATPIAKTSEIPDVSGLATSLALTAAAGDVTAIKAVTDTIGGEFDETNGLIGAISIGTSVGAEKVIPAAYYQLNTAAKTITLLPPYNTVTVEQVLSTYDLLQGHEVYNCLTPRKRKAKLQETGIDISITDGVITYVEAAAMTNDDKLMIIVNTP